MRARNIKPGITKNEELAEGGPSVQFCFACLPMVADREGKLEDRPKRIKAEIFPYYDPEDYGGLDMDGILDFLAEKEFIVRYEVGGSKYIKIINFLKHQRPHSNESASVIPEPLSTMKESTANHGEKDLSPKKQALRTDSLIPNLLKDEGRPGACQPAYIGKTFVLNKESYKILRSCAVNYSDYQFQTLLEKLDLYAIDNPKKYAKNGNGMLKSPGAILRRWLEREPNPQGPSVPPEPDPPKLQPDPNCPLCRGRGIEIIFDPQTGRSKGARKCSCLHPVPVEMVAVQ